jgi:uncharacterized protein (TIGR00661 family)
MARIAYSCCGEGRGHSSRTLTVVEELRSRGHDVRVFASHVAYQVLAPKLPHVTEIPGMVLAYKNNRINLASTLLRNAETWRKKSATVGKIRAELAGFKPDLAVTDFEPFLPLAARNLGVPFVSLDHQHVIPGLDLRPPSRLLPQFAATLAIVHMTHRGEIANLVTSFFRPEKPFKQKYKYFGPILRPDIRKLVTRNLGHVVVYQTSTSFERLPDLLRDLPLEFRFYAFAREGREGNCVFKPRNHPDFFEDLATCSWVLTNGGYTLISESLFLGKPVLSVPVEGQFEQWINAHFLQKLGFGMFCEKPQFNGVTVTEFAARRDKYAHAIRSCEFNGTESVVNELLSFL